jgi:phosphoribosylcarboxyaminoimidazole (NCAIR) mutase
MGKQHLKSNQSNGHREINSKNPLVAIASPSTKLLDDLKDTKNVLNLFGVTSEITVVAAHRSPKKTLRYAQQLEAEEST